MREAVAVTSGFLSFRFLSLWCEPLVFGLTHLPEEVTFGGGLKLIRLVALHGRRLTR